MRQLHPGSPWISEDEVIDDEVVVAITRGELAVLAGAINEALEAVEGWEFSTRLGVSQEKARAIRDQISELLHTRPRR